MGVVFMNAQHVCACAANCDIVVRPLRLGTLTLSQLL